MSEVEIIYVAAEQLEATIASALETLTAEGWTAWTADCCLHCADFPTPAARKALESLDTASWLLNGRGYRHHLIAARERKEAA